MHRRHRPIPRAAALLLATLCAASTFARTPAGPFESFTVETAGPSDVPRATISAWYLPAPRPDTACGTLFLCHGYNQSKQRLAGWEWIRDQLHWNVVMFDFRRHGESSSPWPPSTLGYYEVWDLRAVIDWAESRGLRKPFAAYGVSMGAATALRHAAEDRRLTGVLAVSPFRNALIGAREMVASKNASWIADLMPDRQREILAKVDVIESLAKRDDLRVWIMSGEKDCFPPEEQQAILAGSASPPNLKRLVIAPGKSHHNVYTWKGDALLPSHDQYIRDFLAETERSAAPTTPARHTVVAIAAATLVAVGSLTALRRRSSGRTELNPALDAPDPPPVPPGSPPTPQ